MIPTFKCPFGGRPTNKSQVGGFCVDRKNGVVGYRIGWIPLDAEIHPGEPIIVPVHLLDEFRTAFKVEVTGLKEATKKEPIKVRLAKWLMDQPTQTVKEPRKVKVGDQWITIE